MRDLIIWLTMMAALLVLTAPALGIKPLYAARQDAGPKKAQIEIVEFVPNNYISGKVVGIPSSECGRYKVIVYVKTDSWYLHPYERGGDGLSYASVNKYGTWRINTIKRKYNADKIAFFLVDRDYVPPVTVKETSAVRYKLVHVEDGGGRV